MVGVQDIVHCQSTSDSAGLYCPSSLLLFTIPALLSAFFTLSTDERRPTCFSKYFRSAKRLARSRSALERSLNSLLLYRYSLMSKEPLTPSQPYSHTPNTVPSRPTFHRH